LDKLKMKIKIRKANLKDAIKIGEIYLEGTIDITKSQFPKRNKLNIIKEANKWKKDRIREFKKEINSKKNFWIVALICDKVVGFANAMIEKNKEGRLAMLYVKKEFRKKGIGRKLTQERIEWLKKKGIKKVYAGMFIKNKASRKNLEKIGFKPVSIKLEKQLK